MFVKKSVIIISIILFSGILAFSVSAEETATSDEEYIEIFENLC